MKFVFRKVRATPNEFCQALPDDIAMFLDHVNETGAKLLKHPRGKAFKAEHMLSGGAAHRLTMHRMVAAHARIQKSELFQLSMFWDISQNPDHHRAPDGSLPRLLCNTFMWSEELKRPLHRLELLQSQGF